MSQLRMAKTDLSNLPRVPVPSGYVLRTFQEGDESGMARVYAASGLGDHTAATVGETLLRHACFRPDRVFVLECDGCLVGTAAAWLEPEEPEHGYLHMLGLLPEHRGRQLGAVLIIATLGYTRSEGLRSQHLLTDDWRDAALRLYLRLGYRPLHTDPSHPARWRAVARKLGLPPDGIAPVDAKRIG